MNTHPLLVPVVVLTAACGPTYLAPEMRPDPGADLPPDFLDASSLTRTPGNLLFALARVETNFQMVEGAEEFPGRPTAHGLMGLRDGDLELAADLVGLDPEVVRTDRASNVLAAAALLELWADEEGIDTDDLAAWAPVVARFAGIQDEEGIAEYVHYEVYEALRRGIEIEGYLVEPLQIEAAWPRPMRDGVRIGDGMAIWTPSPNYNSRSGQPVDFVIIHTCEGAYSGCWSWLRNSAAGVSAHYVVNDSGTEVRQLVDENNRAWHIGANYSCSNNNGVECWRDGTSMNSISVGIEHAGYASQSSWNSGLIQRSAELTCGITQRHGIPRDSYHVVGHGKLQPWDRTDPGANWPWTDYLARVNSACGSGSAPPPAPTPAPAPAPTSQFVIDSNNAANDTTLRYIQVSANWWASANVSGYWNTGYWVGPTAATSDPASFWFYESAEQCYKVEAWWTSSTDRPTSVAFLGWDDNDVEVGRTLVNQRINGSKWNTLGTWKFPAGWNRVLLSRWTTPGSYAIADAVRLTASTGCP